MAKIARLALWIAALAVATLSIPGLLSAAEAEAPQNFDREKVQSRLFDIRNSVNQEKNTTNPVTAPASADKVNICKINSNLAQCK